MTDVLIGSVGAATLAQRLRAVPPEVQRSTARELRRVGGDVLADARGRASWSTRIPGSLMMQVRFAGRYPGVVISARASQAPHARPYEGITGASQFKHPVYGNRSVTQMTRPFLRPAVAAAGQALPDALGRAIDEAIAKNNL